MKHPLTPTTGCYDDDDDDDDDDYNIQVIHVQKRSRFRQARNHSINSNNSIAGYYRLIHLFKY